MLLDYTDACTRLNRLLPDLGQFLADLPDLTRASTPHQRNSTGTSDIVNQTGEPISAVQDELLHRRLTLISLLVEKTLHLIRVWSAANTTPDPGTTTRNAAAPSVLDVLDTVSELVEELRGFAISIRNSLPGDPGPAGTP